MASNFYILNYLSDKEKPYEWWLIESQYQGLQTVKERYLSELQMLSVVFSLVSSYAYSSCFTSFDHIKMSTEAEKDCLYLLFYSTFLLSLTGLTFVILQYVQLNIRFFPCTIRSFFSGISGIYPLISSLLTQVTLLMLLATAVYYAYLLLGAWYLES